MHGRYKSTQPFLVISRELRQLRESIGVPRVIGGYISTSSRSRPIVMF